MKTHRLYRHSNRVSSETGAAIDTMIGDPGPTRYQAAKEEILTIIRRLPPSQRRAILVDVLKDIEREM